MWQQNQALARGIASDILDIQFKLIGKELNREKLIKKMTEAFSGDWQHKCLGRTALARLERAVFQADQFHLAVKTLREIWAEQKKTVTL